jgi:hypothetical protein
LGFAEIQGYQFMELQLDELRCYSYANAAAVQGYARAFHKGKRVSTAHVESTVNQTINWRFCKKQQMSWTRAGAQASLHVKVAGIHGTLHRHAGCPQSLHQAA